MNLPLYAAARAAAPSKRERSANAGLWFSRFFSAYDESFTIPKNETEGVGKAGWLKAFVEYPVGDAEQLAGAADRTRHLIAALGGSCVVLETDAPLATGLGISHPVENGFTFHPTYGTPFLCGAAVKGMLRNWVTLWMEVSDENRKATLERWFGMAAGDKSSEESKAGNLIFFDALPNKPVGLACDVLTPHMGGWYESGQSISGPNDYARTLPADWHNPVPSSFLVVGRGANFLFGIAPRNAADQQACTDAKAAMAELRKALDWTGIGAKTATGYGRFIDREAQAALRRQQAGIAEGTEQWADAKLAWDKGRGTLSIVNPITKKTCTGKREHFEALSEATRKRLEKSKPVAVDVTVNVLGNKIDLVEIREKVEPS